MIHSVILPLGPSANKMWRMANGHMILSDEARAYKESAGWAAREQGAECQTGNIAVTLHVFMARRGADADNRAKCVLDSLQGIMYDNDKQISELHIYRHLDKLQPRIEVTVCEVE